MLHTNYKNLLNSIIERNKGFWRLGAISILSRKIQNGEEKYNYLKNLISIHDKKITKYSFLKINCITPINLEKNKKKIKKFRSFRNQSSQMFFVTQIPPNQRNKNFNNKLFMNQEEENMYNPIELHPFEIKYARKRDKNQKYFNIQEIKKEIENSYNYVRNEQIKNRPLTSYYKRKLSRNFFGYQTSKFSNYFKNSLNMNKRRKKSYKNNNNFTTSYVNHKYAENVENWKDDKNKRIIVSEYLRNKYSEENKLFEDIKKNTENKSIFFNLLTKNKTINNSTITDNISEQKDNNFNTIKKNINTRVFNSISSDDRINSNINKKLNFK
jgi:hypothetical protein